MSNMTRYGINALPKKPLYRLNKNFAHLDIGVVSIELAVREWSPEPLPNMCFIMEGKIKYEARIDKTPVAAVEKRSFIFLLYIQYVAKIRENIPAIIMK